MLEFFKAGGPFMIVIVLTSITGMTFLIERALALRRSRIIPPAVEAAVGNTRTREDLPMLTRVCEQQDSALSRLLLLASQHLDWPRDENADSLQTQARHEVARLERGLVVLEIVVGIAPLLGLVGTIHGLISLFGEMGRVAGSGNNADLAKGIAIALNTTLMGLLTAIPALVAWSALTKKVENLAVELELLCDEFLRRMYRAGRGTRQSPNP